MANIYDLITQGNFFEIFTSSYTQILGSDIFFTFILAILIGAIYMKTRSVELAAGILVLGGIVLMPLISPFAKRYFLLIILVGFSLAIYKIFWKRYWGES
jgi:hypothetical protein